MAQTLGLIDVIWRGTKIDVEKGGKVKVGGLKQKPVNVGMQTDYANEYEDSQVDVVMRMRAGDSLLGLWAAGAGELQVLCDTGQTYVWNDAFLSNRPSFTAGEGGKIPVQWMGSVPQELLT